MYVLKFDGLVCEFGILEFDELFMRFNPEHLEDDDGCWGNYSDAISFCDHRCTEDPEEAAESSCPLARTFVGQEKGRIARSNKEPCFYLLDRILTKKEKDTFEEEYEDYFYLSEGVSEVRAKRIVGKIHKWIEENIRKV